MSHDQSRFAGFFTRGGGALVWTSKVHRGAARGAPALQFGWLLLRDDLQIEE